MGKINRSIYSFFASFSLTTVATDTCIAHHIHRIAINFIVLQILCGTPWQRFIWIASSTLVCDCVLSYFDRCAARSLIQLYNVHVFTQRVPFDWQTPFGYLMAVTFTIMSHIIIFTWLMNIVFMVIGFVSFLVLFAEQFEHELDLLNAMDTNKSNASSQLNAKIHRIIGLHCETKQLNKVMNCDTLGGS